MSSPVIMPGMSGPQIAALIAQSRREMKVLYVTGYTQDLIANRLISQPRAALLHKPFSRQPLVAKVQQAFASPPLASLLPADIG